MFEGMTYEVILNDVLSTAPVGVDTRQGSIFYDAVAAICMKIAQNYTDLDLVVTMTSILTATGSALDAKASEYGVFRLQATPAKYYVNFTGADPDVGERFYTNGMYFILYKDENDTYYLQAEEPGTGVNTIYSGTAAVPVNTIEGLTVSTFGLIYENGTDTEDDESFRDRIQEKLSGPAENGNKSHYKLWCESINGIGVARIYPLWNGPNTVKAVLADATGAPCSSTKVAEVQNYIDPNTAGTTVTVDGITYNVGDGLGEGVANLGAHFSAISAIADALTIAFTAVLASGYTTEAAEAEATEKLTAYLADLVLNTPDETTIVVRLSQIGAIISNMNSITDYSNLTINGSASNKTIAENYIPTLQEVNVS